ncbi:hypothetical protein P3S67_022837 [Capsicum chacoense]
MTRYAVGRRSRGMIWAIIAALIYHIWHARNESLWNKAIPRPQVMFKHIQKECKYRNFTFIQRQISRKDRQWIGKLYT